MILELVKKMIFFTSSPVGNLTQIGVNEEFLHSHLFLYKK